jgi:hypothetical protein
MLYILVTFYVTMAAAGYIVEILFGAFGIIPKARSVSAVTEGITWNYTSVLNVLALMVSVALILRFLRTGGPEMIRVMNVSEEEMVHHHGMEPTAGTT